jgi:hypothetical protein
MSIIKRLKRWIAIQIAERIHVEYDLYMKELDTMSKFPSVDVIPCSCEQKEVPVDTMLRCECPCGKPVAIAPDDVTSDTIECSCGTQFASPFASPFERQGY